MTLYCPTTREALVGAVEKNFGFDISPLWQWMTTTGSLPQKLPVDWDPVWGRQGAYEHIRGRQSIRHTSSPKHGVLRKSPAGKNIREPCKLCGIAGVVVMCYHAAIAPIRVPPYKLKLLRLLGGLANRVRTMKASLEKGVDEYQTAHRIFLTARFEEVRQMQQNASVGAWNGKAIALLDEGARDAGKLAELSTYRELKLGEWFSDLEKCILSMEDEVLAGMGLPLQERIFPARAGRPPKMIARARAILKDEGFTWSDVVRLVQEKRDAEDPEGAIARARSQVSAAQNRS
jgi:hypothetical protein